MDYIKRKIKIYKFVQILKRVLDDNNLATDRLQRSRFFEEIKENYFSKDEPLINAENKSVFPVGTANFLKVLNQKNGHNIKSIERNLGDFLKKEFDSYFDDLVDSKVLLADNDEPTSYRLNHNSAMVYLIIGLITFGVSLVIPILKLFIPQKR